MPGNLENSATASSISLEEKIIRSKFRVFYGTQRRKEGAKTNIIARVRDGSGYPAEAPSEPAFSARAVFAA